MAKLIIFIRYHTAQNMLRSTLVHVFYARMQRKEPKEIGGTVFPWNARENVGFIAH